MGGKRQLCCAEVFQKMYVGTLPSMKRSRYNSLFFKYELCIMNTFQRLKYENWKKISNFTVATLEKYHLRDMIKASINNNVLLTLNTLEVRLIFSSVAFSPNVISVYP